MPFKSKAQQRFMFAKHPKMAKRWAHETEDMKSLPEHVKKAAVAFQDELEKIAKVVVVDRPTKLPLLPGDLTAYRKREAAAGGSPGDGSSLGKDNNGYYCYTHRARSKSYPSPAQIPLDRIKFIGSTA